MALPVMEVLGIASSAVGLLKKIAGKSDSQGFENMLAGEMSGKGEVGQSSLKELLTQVTGGDEAAAEELMAGGMGTVLLQLMNNLKQAGLSAADIKSLFSGNGSDLSDAGLKTLLGALGSSNEQITTLMGNDTLKTELKSMIAQGMQQAFDVKSKAFAVKTASGQNPNEIQSTGKQTGGENAKAAGHVKNIDTTPEELAAVKAVEKSLHAFEVKTSDQVAVKNTVNAAVGAPDQINMDDAQRKAANASASRSEALAAFVQGATASDETLNTLLQNAQTLMPAAFAADATAGVKHILAQAIKKTEAKLQIKIDTGITAASLNAATPGKNTGMAAADETLAAFGEKIGVKDDVLKKIFFSTDQTERQEAVQSFTDQLTGYIKDGKTIGKDVQNALAHVRQATTKEEWAGIDSAIKVLMPDLQIPELKTASGKGFMHELAARLGENPEKILNSYVDTTMDQIRFQLPAQLKNGEGAARLELNPPMLGRVDVSVVMEDGKLQATFRVESIVTRDIIQNNMAALKDALADQGIRVSQLNVSAGLDQRQQEHQHQQNLHAQFDMQRQQQGNSGQQERAAGGLNRGGYQEDGYAYQGDAVSRPLSASSGLDLFA